LEHRADLSSVDWMVWHGKCHSQTKPRKSRSSSAGL